jgi:hypothetical protein
MGARGDRPDARATMAISLAARPNARTTRPQRSFHHPRSSRPSPAGRQRPSRGRRSSLAATGQRVAWRAHRRSGARGEGGAVVTVFAAEPATDWLDTSDAAATGAENLRRASNIELDNVTIEAELADGPAPQALAELSRHHDARDRGRIQRPARCPRRGGQRVEAAAVDSRPTGGRRDARRRARRWRPVRLRARRSSTAWPPMRRPGPKLGQSRCVPGYPER